MDTKAEGKIEKESLVDDSWRIYLDGEDLGTMHRWPDRNGVSNEIFTIRPANKMIIRQNFTTERRAIEALIKARGEAHKVYAETEREDEVIS